ncbi:hypothetical protein R4B61_03135 [Fructilactobacillus vespulae]|uniref:hypothetical protein n=1 Tax=Fructilactobacillus vespulae TaxID=1249630 RepID=UPI0039B3C0E4
MKLLQLNKKETSALKKWKAREQQTSRIHKLMHLGKETTLKLTNNQIQLFVQIKLKY